MNTTPTTLKAEALLALRKLQPFMGRSQHAVLGSNLRGEEGEFFAEMLIALEKRIREMPKTYEQDGKGEEAIAYLHYFMGSCDWWITEKDCEPDQLQAFGYADLGYGGELGYISITELARLGVELDLYWTPKTLRQIKERET